MKYTLTGSAKALNWILAASLAVSSVAAVMVFEGSVGFSVSVAALAALLLVGVLVRYPLAYIGIATLSFFGAAAALRRADALLGMLNVVAMGSALFVRSRLVSAQSAGSLSERSTDENA